jgi:hypothetical protein
MVRETESRFRKVPGMINYENARITLFKRLERPNDKPQAENEWRAKRGINSAKNERLRCCIVEKMYSEGKKHEKN